MGGYKNRGTPPSKKKTTKNAKGLTTPGYPKGKK